MNFKKHLSKEHEEMLKSWSKVFLASVATLIAAGETNFGTILLAGVASVIPLVITWLDPNDLRFGKIKVQPKPVAKKVAPKKALPKKTVK